MAFLICIMMTPLAFGNSQPVQVSCEVTFETCIAVAEAGHPATYTFFWQAAGAADHSSSQPFDCSGGGGGEDIGVATCPIKCWHEGPASVTVTVYDGNAELIGSDTTNFQCFSY